MTQLSLPTEILRLHRALDNAGLPHAFGGALALALARLLGPDDERVARLLTPDPQPGYSSRP